MASGFPSKKKRRQSEAELFATLEHARARYQYTSNDLRTVIETAASVGNADGAFSLQETGRLSRIAHRALLDYEAALRACTDFVLNGGLS